MGYNTKAHHNSTQKPWYLLRESEASYTTYNILSYAMWDNYPFFFRNKHTHTREKERGSNTKTHIYQGQLDAFGGLRQKLIILF